MARNSDQLFEAENTGGLLSGLLAEEDEFDRRALWRLGSWAAASVGAVIIALYANQSAIGVRRDQVAATELARQTQQAQLLAKESQNEARRLAAAIDTLNSDRDRLYSRVTVLEQGLDSVTGSIARQNSALPPSGSGSAPAAASTPAEAPVATQNPPPAPVASAVTTMAASTPAAATDKPRATAPVPEPAPATVAAVPQALANTPVPTPALPLMPAKSIMAPPDPAAGKLIETGLPPKPIAAAPIPDVVALAPPAEDAEADAPEAMPPKVQQTEFAVDLGGANSIGGLRALWRGLRSKPALAGLRPVITVKEGRSVQLRLVAGPLKDAAAAAKICAGLLESKRGCETTEFDGQRLVMTGGDEAPAESKPVSRKRGSGKHMTANEPAKLSSSTLSQIFGRR